MPSKWEYGGAYLRHPVKGKRVEFADGSIVQEHDIFDPLPKFMLGSDLLFVDPPWNVGNLNGFYTKAGRKDYQNSFLPFVERLFRCIKEIHPHTCYVEVGKEFLADFIVEMRKEYRYVTFCNSTYYHSAQNLCYVVRGASKRRRLQSLEGLDEENIIAWVCANEDFECIGDLCIGRGLVGVYAHANNRRFSGTELNHRRLSVLIEILHKAGLEYKLHDIL